MRKTSELSLVYKNRIRICVDSWAVCMPVKEYQKIKIPGPIYHFGATSLPMERCRFSVIPKLILLSCKQENQTIYMVT